MTRRDGRQVALCVEGYESGPAEVVLDLDATDIPLHGDQEERFFHGYYREYCYLPLLFLIGRHPVMVRMRSAARDAAAGVEEDLGWLLDRLRQAWPSTRIILRTDSGFCREAIMATCVSRAGVDYVMGLAKNRRLEQEIGIEMAEAVLRAQEKAAPARRSGSSATPPSRPGPGSVGESGRRRRCLRRWRAASPRRTPVHRDFAAPPRLTPPGFSTSSCTALGETRRTG